MFATLGKKQVMCHFHTPFLAVEQYRRDHRDRRVTTISSTFAARPNHDPLSTNSGAARRFVCPRHPMKSSCFSTSVLSVAEAVVSFLKTPVHSCRTLTIILSSVAARYAIILPNFFHNAAIVLLSYGTLITLRFAMIRIGSVHV